MSCVPNVASFSGLVVFTICLVYPMLQVSLDCLHPISCVPNVANFSGLFVFALCLVYPILPVSLDCLSSPYVLCTQCYQFLWIGNIGYTRYRVKTIQRNLQHWVHKTYGEDNQSRETGNIGYTRHKAKTNNPEKLATLGTQDIRRRQAIQRNWQH
jgi:hypothetical protein